VTGHNEPSFAPKTGETLRKLSLAVLSTLALTFGSLPLANADVTATQQVVLEQDKPVKGRYKMSYTNYQERTGLCSGSRVYGTYKCLGYRVRRGTVAMKLMTYKLKENTRYDYYLLDVDINNANRTGTSKYGWTNVTIKTLSGSLVDSTETKTILAEENSCKTLDLSLSTPWPVVSGTVGLGSVELCDDAARWKRRRDSLRVSVYKANMMGETSHLSTQRWVKVKRGTRPKFEVTVQVPRDTCDKSKDGWCTAYTNHSAARTYTIGTT
jgi:hypothetical protein